MLAKEDLIKQITDNLSWIEVSTRNRGLQGLFDQHVISEHFFAGLLNIAFGWSLELLPKNQAAVDLRDRVNHRVIQVTGTSDRKKIEYTIAQFARERENFASYALAILIIGRKGKYRKRFAGQEEIDFNPQEDLWDVPDLLSKVRSLDTAALQRIAEFLKRELKGDPRIAAELREERLRMYERFKAFFTDLARTAAREKGGLITDFKNHTDQVSFLGMPEVDALRSEIISRAWTLQRVEARLNGREIGGRDDKRSHLLTSTTGDGVSPPQSGASHFQARRNRYG
jgi:hypothetical protein